MLTLHRDLTLAVVGQVVVLGVLTATVGLASLGWLVGLSCALLTATLLLRWYPRTGARVLGPADRVTLTRAVLTGGVAALVAQRPDVPAAPAVLVSLAAVALVLDGVDGAVARRTRTASARGARFDMEVDAFLVLVLSLHVAAAVGVWVLAIGAARYLFVAAGWRFGWLRAALPARYWRKVVAVVQGVALTLAAPGLLPAPVAGVVLLGALALLAESFGRDVWWLRRQAHGSRTSLRTRSAAEG